MDIILYKLILKIDYSKKKQKCILKRFFFLYHDKIRKYGNFHNPKSNFTPKTEHFTVTILMGKLNLNPK